MSELYLHGIVREKTPIPASAPVHRRIASAGGAAHQSGIVFLASPISEDMTEDPRAAHDAILTAYSGFSEIVPIGPEAIAVAEKSAARLLDQNAAHYTDLLDRVSGAAEFLAKVTSGPIRGRITRLSGERDSGFGQTEALTQLAEQLAGHARSVRSKAPRPGSGRSPVLLELALLIPHEVRGLFALELPGMTLRAAEHGLILDVSGPWPAFTFSDDLIPAFQAAS